jgi:ATP/maltotriose-dependent transcriptional regulator MalT
MLYGAGMLAYRLYAWGEIWPRPYLEESLKLFRLLGDQKRTADALTALGRLLMSGDIDTSRKLCEESLEIQRELKDSRGIAAALDSLGRLSMTQGDYISAHRYAEESLSIYRGIGDRLGEADELLLIANNAFFQGDLETARTVNEELLEQHTDLEKPHDAVNARSMLGTIITFQGELTLAESILQDTLTLAQEIGHERATLNCLSALSLITFDRGEIQASEEFLQQALTVARKHRLVRVLPSFLQGFAMIRMARGNTVDAAQMMSASYAFLHTFNYAPPPVFVAYFEPFLHDARSQLGETAFAEAWAAGPQIFMEMAPDEFRKAKTVKVAPIPPLIDQPPQTRPVSSKTGIPQQTQEGTDQLTPRELDVLCLVAQGLTNTNVAEKLIVSPRTVHAHLRSIYSKLDVNSRAAATRYAIENDLVDNC